MGRLWSREYDAIERELQERELRLAAKMAVQSVDDDAISVDDDDDSSVGGRGFGLIGFGKEEEEEDVRHRVRAVAVLCCFTPRWCCAVAPSLTRGVSRPASGVVRV